MINERDERKLGRAVLECVMEIKETPHNQMLRFNVLKRRLERVTGAYREATGSEYLLHNANYYGFEVAPK